MKTKLICVQTMFDHWSKYTGYHQYLKYLKDDFDIEHIRVESVNTYLPLSLFKKLFCTQLYKRRMSNVATINDILNEIELVRKVKEDTKVYQRIIIHFMDGEYGFNWFGTLLRLHRIDRKRVKIVATYHQPPNVLRKLINSEKRFVDLDLILTVGSNQLDFFESKVREKVKFIHHGIDTVFFKPGEANPVSEEMTCITVGHWLRDFQTLYKVINKSPESIRFRIVTNPKHLSAFEENSKVEILSGVSHEELLKVYQTSDIGLMPLTDTTANNGILEMMACGLPIITTDVGAIRDYVTEESAIILQKGDSNTMLKSVIELSSDENKRAQMAVKLRDRAMHLDWTVIAGKMKSLYEDL